MEQARWRARQRTLLTRLARSRVIAVSPHTLGRQAHWFYEDFCRTTAQGRALRSFSLREFAELLFEQHPSLEQHKVRKELARPARDVWLRCSGCTRRPRADWTASTSNSRHTRCAASCAAPTAARLTRRPQHNVPVFGAIMVNPGLDKCLMVKGWKSGASWGFPKGKVRPSRVRRRRSRDGHRALTCACRLAR